MASATATKPAQNGTGTPATAPRMTLQSVKRGGERRPDRIVCVGTEGVGKTTFAAEAPGVVFICAEDGIPTMMADTPRFPEPKGFADVREAIRTLINEDHTYQTLVIDTLDWLEPMIWKDLCATNGWADIESPGYGKGYTAATEKWRTLLADLDTLRSRKGMEIILLAHAAIKPFKNPAGDDYDRYECKLHKGASALVKEWADSVLFAVHEEFAKTEKGKVTRKGVSTGRRVIHTERTAAWDAKNRWALPPELPLNYADYAAARAACKPADPDALMAEGKELVGKCGLDEATTTKTLEWLENQRTQGAATLSRAVDRLRSKVAEQGGE